MSKAKIIEILGEQLSILRQISKDNCSGVRKFDMDLALELSKRIENLCITILNLQGDV